MITSRDLLALAAGSIGPEASPAALSRSISTLYYALFHAVLETARARVKDCTHPVILQHYIASFDHLALRDTALQVSALVEPTRRKALKGGSLAPWTSLLPSTPSAALTLVCETFPKMQQLRHQADYHPEWTVTCDEAETYKEGTAAALQAWRSIEDSDEAIVFLFASLGVLKFR